MGHTAECRRRIEAEMAKDPILKQRLEAAQDRRDRYVASEVERGDEHRAGSEQAKESREATAGSVGGEKRNFDDDGVPEVVEDDGDEIEERPQKKARTGSVGEEAQEDGPERVVEGSTETTGEQEEESAEPDAKRSRTLSVVNMFLGLILRTRRMLELEMSFRRWF